MTGGAAIIFVMRMMRATAKSRIPQFFPLSCARESAIPHLWPGDFLNYKLFSLFSRVGSQDRKAKNETRDAISDARKMPRIPPWARHGNGLGPIRPDRLEKSYVYFSAPFTRFRHGLSPPIANVPCACYVVYVECLALCHHEA